MKKTPLTLGTIALAMLLTACDGGSDAPPPPASTAEGKKSVGDLQKLAANVQSQCCQTFGPYMVNYGMGAMGAPHPLAPPPLPNVDGCRDAVMNFDLQFRTIDNGSYANRPDAQNWRNAQGVNVVNCVGGMMAGAGLSVSPMDFSKYHLAALMISQNIQSAIPSVPFGGYLGGMQNGPGAMPPTGGAPGAPIVLRPPPPGAPGYALGPQQLAGGYGPAHPFNPATQVMPYLPPIPAGY